MERERLMELRRRLDGQSADLGRQIFDLERVRDGILILLHALDGLQTGWRQEDPGKHGPNWFFVRNVSSKTKPDVLLKRIGAADRFWAIELVDDPAEARRGTARNAASPRRANGQRIRLGRVEDATRLRCRQCGRSGPLVGRYDQVEDSPFGDRWQLDLYVVCVSCSSLSFVASRIEEDRIF